MKHELGRVHLFQTAFVGVRGMFGLGAQEILLVLVLVLIFFGAEKIPQLARSLGKGMSEFRRAQQDFKEELAKAAEPATAPETATTPQPRPDPPDPSYLVCPSCQGQTARGSLYCSQCGRRMSVEIFCSLCHRHLENDEKFCPNCGQARLA